MDEIVQQLVEIEAWIDDNPPPPSNFGNNSEFMRFAIEIMHRCLFLLKLGTASVPDAEIATRGYTKHRAIIVGHLVRITKLYEGASIHVKNSHFELAAIFFRLIFETAIKAEYLIKSKSKRKSCRSFIVASYRPEKEILQDLKAAARMRPINKVGKRIKRKILSWLKEDRISQTELMNNTTWYVDGKNFRALLKESGRENLYSYGFGCSGHHIHGDWYEIGLYHLNREGRHYTPNLTFEDPDPRLTCSLTHICLETLLMYLKWNKSDPDYLISSVIAKLQELNTALDVIHESTLDE